MLKIKMCCDTYFYIATHYIKEKGMTSQYSYDGDITPQIKYCFSSDQYVEMENEDNPFVSFSLDAISLMIEALDLYVQNGRRLGYDYEEIKKIVDLPYEERVNAMLNIVPSFDHGPQITQNNFNMLIILRQYLLCALEIIEAKEQSKEVIPALEKLLFDETKKNES